VEFELPDLQKILSHDVAGLGGKVNPITWFSGISTPGTKGYSDCDLTSGITSGGG
jgi:hypothetical protein